ncbi:Subtilisin-like protease SBT3.3 [Vitis vinifera]|uniref:Subtilisin-like protease SBT3.3 n=1 Tax=Vitis vinifera TaxID=29760 RepID=A0A438I4R3_VITVI|nr:Subtilisin-like protease SBT3.3 [Vitis vinifera]
MDVNPENLRAARRNHLLMILLVLFLAQQYFHRSLSFVEGLETTSNVYIVYMGEKKHEDPATIKKSHHEMLSTLLGSKEAAKSSILYSYKHGFSGFAAKLTESQAEDIAGSIQLEAGIFLGLQHDYPTNVLTETNLGRGVIIGVIDSGVWPESESFKDEGMGPIPSRWKGICQHGERFNSTNCNRKLIGARWFFKGIHQEIGKFMNITDNLEFLSPRDGIGHGTHTASTAAGYFVQKANYRGLATGLARGGAPLARLAIYKACWAIISGACSDADILKAFDKAIHDGVDILSLSVGNDIPLFSYVDQRDSIAIASFHAIAKGITVVCSAGNDGPFSQTIANTAPWLITVAATTIDRAFPTAIILGNNQTFLGQSIDTGKHKLGFTGLTYSERVALDPKDDSAKDCQPGSLNATLAAGKIILCFSKSDKQDIISASVNYEVGTQILTYIRKARSPTAKLKFPKTVTGKWASPHVAYFSSRGPSSMSPAVLKPDVAAPGVNILAAYSPVDAGTSNGFAFLSGTSMACPHVSGLAALIKSAHPTWSPAAIRSALVTSASQTGTDGMDIIEEGPTRKAADPFDIGGGHVNPNKALKPGLIYNISMEDYIQFLCSMGYSNPSIGRLTKTTTNCTRGSHFQLNLNLPSITIPNLKKKVTVMRTVTNVGHINSVYKAEVQAPYGIKMAVEPHILSFNLTTQFLPFKVTFFSTQTVHGDYKFGSLTWTDGEHFVRSPIAIRAIKFDMYADV